MRQVNRKRNSIYVSAKVYIGRRVGLYGRRKMTRRMTIYGEK